MQTDTQPARRLLTIDDCASRLGISRASIYPLVMSGQIKSVVIGARTRRIALEDLENYVQRLRSGEAA
jgi:excisionase family DNA binding protein